MRSPNLPSSRHWATSCSTRLWLATTAAVFMSFAVPVSAQKPRARDLGVPFEGTPGSLNSITDVAGVEVGHVTLIRGSGSRVIGEGPVRTGVTAVFPRGTAAPDPVFAAWFSLNGDGEMTGTTWVQDSGILEGPVMITNTLSVGIVHHAVIQWGVEKRFSGEGGPGRWLASLPVVAETWDGSLNDIYGQHVTVDDALAAIENASGGPVEEGAVGGGTGMICHRFKGGIGTSSRLVGDRRSDLHLGHARSVQLRGSRALPGRRRARRTGDYGSAALPGRCPRGLPRGRRRRVRPGRLHHRGSGYRRTRLAPSAQACGEADLPGLGPKRQHIGERLGRHLHRVLHGQP